VKKTKEEIEELKARVEARRLEKERRKKEQEQNVLRKKAKQEADNKEEGEDEEDNDYEYFRQEVGEAPDPGKNYLDHLTTSSYLPLTRFSRTFWNLETNNKHKHKHKGQKRNNNNNVDSD
jgi:hypothetical protein